MERDLSFTDMAILRASQHSANESSLSQSQTSNQNGDASANEKSVLQLQSHTSIQTDESLKANQSISDTPILPNSKVPDGKSSNTARKSH